MTVLLVSPALAQSTSGGAPMAAARNDAPAPRKKYPKGFVPGTPLDTIMKSHLTTTVPEAKDFVRETRPDDKALDYTPLTGGAAPDPERPKPRDRANVEALQAELEQDGARNAQKARGLMPSHPARRRAAKKASD